MRVLLAFDKFKDSLAADAACDAAATALRKRHPDWSLDSCPLADGGEGFAALLTTAARGQLLSNVEFARKLLLLLQRNLTPLSERLPEFV